MKHMRSLVAIALAMGLKAPAERRVFQLDNNDPPPGAKRFLCGLDGVKLAEGSPRTTVTIIRTGTFSDPRYGTFEITRDMLLSMVRNFDAGAYGQDILLDVAHKPEHGSAAKILSLKVDGNRLRAEAEFTPYGVEAVKTRGFKYLSAEFVDDFVDNETHTHHGPTLLGAGLTTRPVIKRMDPVTLAEGTGTTPVFLHPELIRQLSESLEQTTMKWLEELKRRLAQRKLGEAQITTLTGAFEATAKNLGEDDAALQALVEQFDTVGKQLAEAGATGAITLHLADPAYKVLSAADIIKLMDDREAARLASATKLATDKAAKVKLFSDTLTAATGLGDDTRKLLSANVDGLITGEMSDAQVKSLAENQIALGNQIESSKQLASLGYPIRSGSTHISVDDSNQIKTLSENVRKGLQQTQEAFEGKLVFAEPDKQSPFIKKLLAQFDNEHAYQLHQEAKMLAGGPVTTGDLAIPASYQRAVIEQVYQRLDILSLVNASVDPTTGATHTITYQTRDTSAVRNGGIVYEGQPIHRAGIATANDFAYIAPRKLAMDMTNEAAFFSRNNTLVNFDAWGANVVSNSQVMRELVTAAIANRMLRDSDAFSVVDVAVGTATTAYTGAANAYKTASFPVVRPYQARDLKGNAVGNPEQPVVVKDGATVLVEFDGSGTQAAGKYYRVLSYNLGLFQICDQTGAASAPAGAVTAGYSYTTNVLKVDTDIPAGSTYEKQMNKILQAVGARKAMLSQQRYVKPDFFLASDVLTNMITDAEGFTEANSRADASIDAQGNLQPVKGIAGWASDAPGIDLGDERMLLGQRANFWYTIAKTYQVGVPYELFDSNGQALGKRGAYGEEYSSQHIPAPLRGRFTSILAYSVTGARGA
jgi:hypothetical protein